MNAWRLGASRALVWLGLSWTGVVFAQAPPIESVPANPEDRARAEQEAREALETVSDAMLEPVPAPAKVVSRWRQALELLRTRSPELLRAHANVEMARGRARMALASALPTLVLTGQVNHHLITGQGIDITTGIPVTLPNPQTIVTGNVAFRVPVLDARAWYEHGTAKRSIEQAELDVDEAERQIIGALAESLVVVVTAERLCEVSRVSLTAALQTLSLNQKRARIGATTAVDVLRAEQEVAKSREQVIEADEALRRAREALGLALGDTEAWGVTPTLKLDELRRAAEETCRRTDSLSRRSDILASVAAENVAERRAKGVKYSFLPTIEANTILNYTSFARFSPNASNTTWTIGALLSWDLYDGGLRYGERRLREGESRAAQQDTIDRRRRAEFEVRQAERGVDVALGSLEVARTKRSASVRSAELSRLKFVNGTGSSFDMVDTVRSAREAELDVTVKEFQLLRAQIGAFLALASCDI